MGRPETLADRRVKIEVACREIKRDPVTLGVTALVGLWWGSNRAGITLRKPRLWDRLWVVPAELSE